MKTKSLRKEFLNPQSGITLIALVVTIIVLLILVAVTINVLGNDGIITKAIKANEETIIAAYYEKIEMIRAELQLENTDYVLPTLVQLQEEFSTNQISWVASAEISSEISPETLVITTKEGYIFYLTATETEYKGKGKVEDTSDLRRSDVIELTILENISNGKKVQVTNLSEKDYYKIEYCLEENWTEIASGESVDVAYGQTIQARLVYGSSKGQIHRLDINHTNPTISASSIDTTNVMRKNNISLANLFDITWGSDGTGTVAYEVTGTQKIGNISFSNNALMNLNSLEIGSYTVNCTITSPVTNQTVSAEKEVEINQLFATTVINESGTAVNANGMYSEYDLAYFRDLVNGGNYTLNAKLMNDIDLTNVCSASVGSWKPMGNYKPTGSATLEEITEEVTIYNGIFEGDSHIVKNLYINEPTLYRQGLFGCTGTNNFIKNLTVEGSIYCYNAPAGIVSVLQGKVVNCINKAEITAERGTAGGICGRCEGKISNCKNEANITGKTYIGGICGYLGAGTIENSISSRKSINSEALVGGICGVNESGTIQECVNLSDVTSTGRISMDGDTSNNAGFTGGIVGHNYSTVTRCINQGIIIGAYRVNGGISGRNYGTISYCCNTGNITGEAVTGGIVGNNRGNVSYVYNIADKIEGTNGNIGGIAGNQNTTSNIYTKFCYNKATIVGSESVGGIMGDFSIGTVNSAYNIGALTCTGSNVGQVAGYVYSNSAITNSGGTTESAMANWSQDSDNATVDTINNKIGSGFKKELGGVPSLGIIISVCDQTVSF